VTTVRPLLCLAGIAVLVLGACGSDKDDDDSMVGDGSTTSERTTTDHAMQPTRTVEVEMTDNLFDPQEIDVAKGETVKFEFDNTGAVAHDAFVGDAQAQAEHEDEMNGDHMSGGSEMGHDGEDAITVEPGKKGELTQTFDKAGTLEIGCHEPGHYAGGMKLTVTVG
jgi:uncharacterized cupredoxin-like copper-binding protein